MVPADDPISVAELLRRLRRAVEVTVPGVWIDGEVGSLRLVANGHAYFTLKDESEDAVVDCVLFRGQVAMARRHLVEGARLQVFARGTVYVPRGRLQLVVDRVRPQGRGALLEALERLKRRLAEEGLFDPGRKRPLPDEPTVIGVVTSATGAAFQDIRTVAFRRGGAHLLLAPAVVQGDGAAESIVKALALVGRHPAVDVIIVGRGGGSFEDLMAFNDERVVRAIAGSAVPIVSAVGHEIDTTLADLAADVRAATPSQAAELIVKDAVLRREALVRHRQALARAMRGRLFEDGAVVARLRRALVDPRFLIADRQQQLDEQRARIERFLRRGLGGRRHVLSALGQRLFARHPRAVLVTGRSDLGRCRTALASAMRARVAQERQGVGVAAASLDALSPLAVLGRGYAIVHRSGKVGGSAAGRADEVVPTPTGGVKGEDLGAAAVPPRVLRVVRSAAEVVPGDALFVRLGQGRIDATVTDVHGSEEPCGAGVGRTARGTRESG